MAHKTVVHRHTFFTGKFEVEDILEFIKQKGLKVDVLSGPDYEGKELEKKGLDLGVLVLGRLPTIQHEEKDVTAGLQLEFYTTGVDSQQIEKWREEIVKLHETRFPDVLHLAGEGIRLFPAITPAPMYSPREPVERAQLFIRNATKEDIPQLVEMEKKAFDEPHIADAKTFEERIEKAGEWFDIAEHIPFEATHALVQCLSRNGYLNRVPFQDLRERVVYTGFDGLIYDLKRSPLEQDKDLAKKLEQTLDTLRKEKIVVPLGFLSAMPASFSKISEHADEPVTSMKSFGLHERDYRIVDGAVHEEAYSRGLMHYMLLRHSQRAHKSNCKRIFAVPVSDRMKEIFKNFGFLEDKKVKTKGATVYTFDAMLPKMISIEDLHEMDELDLMVHAGLIAHDVIERQREYLKKNGKEKIEKELINDVVKSMEKVHGKDYVRKGLLRYFEVVSKRKPDLKVDIGHYRKQKSPALLKDLKIYHIKKL